MEKAHSFRKQTPRPTPRTRWEVYVFALLLVTVIGILLNAPVNSFPNFQVTKALGTELDPYDVQINKTGTIAGGRIETGGL